MIVFTGIFRSSTADELANMVFGTQRDMLNNTTLKTTLE